MTNGPATHEWRLAELETRMDRIERRIQAATWVLIANLGGIVALLAKAIFLP